MMTAPVSLIVDDAHIVRKNMCAMFEREGLPAVSSASALEALEVLATQKIGLIITDFNMPGMNGIEFVKQVRTLSDHGATIIIMLTTECSEDMRARGTEAGVSYWINKPIKEQSFMPQIKKLIRTKVAM